jgi:lipoate-protein ligase A
MSRDSSVLRVIIDPPAAGAWNMAVDEALLLSTEHEGLTLRFYSWQEPTLSLGYFQAMKERQQHPPSMTCPVVRRASGGGAIVHDRELTYSLIAPVDQRFGDSARALYGLVHQSLCDVLSDWNIPAERYSPSSPALDRPGEPFLCFVRRSPGDVLLAGYKICGSAQRRHLSRVLQHGSLLWQRSRAAPELPGVTDLRPEAPDLVGLQGAWLTRLAHLLRVVVAETTLSQAQHQAAEEIAQGKFQHPNWTLRR